MPYTVAVPHASHRPFSKCISYNALKCNENGIMSAGQIDRKDKGANEVQYRNEDAWKFMVNIFFPCIYVYKFSFGFSMMSTLFCYYAPYIDWGYVYCMVCVVGFLFEIVYCIRVYRNMHFKMHCNSAHFIEQCSFFFATLHFVVLLFSKLFHSPSRPFAVFPYRNASNNNMSRRSTKS